MGAVTAKAKAIIAKYPGCKRLARNHLIAYIEEIEERWKKQHEKRE